MNRENPIHKTKQGPRTGLFLDNQSHSIKVKIGRGNGIFRTLAVLLFCCMVVSVHEIGQRGNRGDKLFYAWSIELGHLRAEAGLLSLGVELEDSPPHLSLPPSSLCSVMF